MAHVLKVNFAVSVAVKFFEAKLKVDFIKWSVRIYKLADALSVFAKRRSVDETHWVCVDLVVEESSLDQCLFL